MGYTTQAILLVSVGIIMVRFTPFILFRNDREIPSIVQYMTKLLPTAIIPMLIIYSLKNTRFVKYPYGIPEIISILSVIILQKLFRNTFISIIFSTIVYMTLIQKIFV